MENAENIEKDEWRERENVLFSLPVHQMICSNAKNIYTNIKLILQCGAPPINVRFEMGNF